MNSQPIDLKRFSYFIANRGVHPAAGAPERSLGKKANGQPVLFDVFDPGGRALLRIPGPALNLASRSLQNPGLQPPQRSASCRWWAELHDTRGFHSVGVQRDAGHRFAERHCLEKCAVESMELDTEAATYLPLRDPVSHPAP